jgi:hypothetical protein
VYYCIVLYTKDGSQQQPLKGVQQSSTLRISQSELETIECFARNITNLQTLIYLKIMQPLTLQLFYCVVDGITLPNEVLQYKLFGP